MATFAVHAFLKRGLHILDPTFSVDRFPSPRSEKVLLSRVSGAAINRASEEAATGDGRAVSVYLHGARTREPREACSPGGRRAAGGRLGQGMYSALMYMTVREDCRSLGERRVKSNVAAMRKGDGSGPQYVSSFSRRRQFSSLPAIPRF